MKRPMPETAKHGVSAYRNYGCRCGVCREANSRATAAYRERLRSSPVPVDVHGVNGYQNYGCRCSVCRGANAAAARALTKGKRAELAALRLENVRLRTELAEVDAALTQLQERLGQ